MQDAVKHDGSEGSAASSSPLLLFSAVERHTLTHTHSVQTPETCSTFYGLSLAFTQILVALPRVTPTHVHLFSRKPATTHSMQRCIPLLQISHMSYDIYCTPLLLTLRFLLFSLGRVSSVHVRVRGCCHDAV